MPHIAKRRHVVLQSVLHAHHLLMLMTAVVTIVVFQLIESEMIIVKELAIVIQSERLITVVANIEGFGAGVTRSANNNV